VIELKRYKINENTKIIFCISLCIIASGLLLVFPQNCADGVRRGLRLCAETMVPSLFPFLVLSSFILSSGITDFAGEKTDRIFRKIFRCSGICGCTIFFSLFAGFPVGCSMASELYSKNKITQSEARRIALSSVNAGPAFVIGAVGTMMLSSFRAGVILFVSLSLSSLIIAFLSRFILAENMPVTKKSTRSVSISQSLVSSVYNASKSMFSICAWIILFSCLINIISYSGGNEKFILSLKAFFEVSTGCAELANKESPVVLAAILGWSGLCVHCQVFPYILRIGLKAKYFFCSRILHAMLSSVICHLLLKIFPCAVSVFSSGTETITKIFAVSAPAAAGLILMCAIFILDLDTSKKV